MLALMMMFLQFLSFPLMQPVLVLLVVPLWSPYDGEASRPS